MGQHSQQKVLYAGCHCLHPMVKIPMNLLPNPQIPHLHSDRAGPLVVSRKHDTWSSEHRAQEVVLGKRHLSGALHRLRLLGVCLCRTG